MPDVVLSEFEQLVLIALVRLGNDAYGVTICDDIAARSGRAASIAAVYKTLDRLETRGFVASRIGEPTSERGGRRKKHFKVLALGQRALKQSMAALKRMTAGIESEVGL